MCSNGMMLTVVVIGSLLLVWFVSCTMWRWSPSPWEIDIAVAITQCLLSMNFSVKSGIARHVPSSLTYCQHVWK